LESLSFLLIIAVAVAGGFIGHRLKLPAGGMLGAMIAVITLQMIFEQSALPSGLQVILQLASGTMIGSRVTKKDALDLKRLALPTIIIIICMFIINIAIGSTMYRFSKLDIVTALFASAPGGMMDMAIISAELGANPAYVALLQLSRLMFIFTCMVPFYRKLIAKIKPPADPALSEPSTVLPENEPQNPDPAHRYIWVKKLCITLLCGCTTGIALWLLDIPAGAIIGAMLGTAICNIVTAKAYFPSHARLPLQVLAGAFIGMRMDRASILAIGNLLIPAIILFVGVIVITFTTAFIVHKITRLELTTCLLASTPGGLTEMALMADDLGLDAPKIAILQTARLMSVIIFFPTMLHFVIRIIG